MQVTNRRTGEVVQLPDEYDDDQIINHFAGQQTTPLAQSFIGSAQQNVGPQLAQTLAQGPQRSTLPNIGGGAMVGLTPQQAQFTLQSAQQSNVDSMEQRMRQQQQVQNSIEAEKDRSQTLKLRQQELKNAIQERKIAADLAKFEAEMNVSENAKDRSSRESMATNELLLRADMADSDNAIRQQEFGLRERGMGIQEQELGLRQQQMQEEREYRAQTGWGQTTIARQNPETGAYEPWLAWTKRGFHPEYISPAPASTKDSDIVSSPNDPRIMEDRNELVRLLMRQDQEASIVRPLGDIQAEALASARIGRGQKPFVNQQEMDQWIKMEQRRVRDELLQANITGKDKVAPEVIEKEAKIDAETAAAEMMGLVLGTDFLVGEEGIELNPNSAKVLGVSK